MSVEPRVSEEPAKRPLGRLIALAYAVLIIYASLHPLDGWRRTGLPLFYFIDVPWPRYWTAFDLASNVLAYVILGFLLSLCLVRRRVLSALLGFVLGSLLSLSMETIQTFLPSRVPSNVDWACNSLGAFIGALLALACGMRLIRAFNAWQKYLLAPAPHFEFGLVLAGLWLLALLSPEILLFGTGDLRQYVGLAPAVPYHAPSFFSIEATVTGCNMLAMGLLLRSLMLGTMRAELHTLGFFFLALFIRTLSAAILVAPASALMWFTPGAALGLLAGSVALFISHFLPDRVRLLLAGLALMLSTVLVNLSAPNPYSLAALSTWRQGHFLNFNGLTRLTASCWPFLALVYLMRRSGYRKGDAPSA